MMDIEKIAKVCHETNRAYCAGLGDTSHKPWEETSWAIKQSAIAGVAFVQENPDASLGFVHENWRKHKQIEGWVYGEEKSEEKRTHPCMRPYEELAPEQRVKDKLFRAIALSLLDNAV
jgi:hypothetical protein